MRAALRDSPRRWLAGVRRATAHSQSRVRSPVGTSPSCRHVVVNVSAMTSAMTSATS
ncbi:MULTISPECIES: hypothetical protein [unclassified Nonomuraea]|uniref:hypothetical protein n=1 Tax=unclassified Nonomuraea TaxID=2593643 RepID=UPI0033F28856